MATDSLTIELESKGYLSLQKFVKYLKDNHPHAAISYPTAVRLVKEGKLRAIRVGQQHRLLRKEVVRWVAEGNRESPSDSPEPTS